jgi:hypothetical protein
LGAYLRRGDGRRAWAAGLGGGRGRSSFSGKDVARPRQQMTAGSSTGPRERHLSGWMVWKRSWPGSSACGVAMARRQRIGKVQCAQVETDRRYIGNQGGDGGCFLARQG